MRRYVSDAVSAAGLKRPLASIKMIMSQIGDID